MKKIPRRHCREISHKISNEEIVAILEKAKSDVKDWTKPARVNRLFTRGKFWNMFCENRNETNLSPILKQRILEEFGEFADEKWHPIPKKKYVVENPYHETPDFLL